MTLPPDVTPFSSADVAARTRADRLFFDVDDTLTLHGQLPEVAATALYRAHAAGISLVAVTGRSFAWAEMLLRLFPLDAAVAETGACALVRAGGARIEVLHTEPDPLVRRRNDEARARACERVLAAVPAARLALDNPGRLYDSAFDLVESGPPVAAADAARIRALLEEEGLHTAQSSVHVNAWKVGPSGPFDKASMVDRLLRERFGTTLPDAAERLVYVGDSTNDGPLFAAAGLSVGVANVRPHLPALAALGQLPKFVVDGQGGHGFAQVVAALLEER
jgi:HAD superfamily hydrolase (TIGR01484 family)